MNHTIDQLIDALVDGGRDLTDGRRSELIFTLRAKGPAALEPILEALEQLEDESTRHALLDAASDLGVHDERLRSHLVDLLDPHPMLATMFLSTYGDPDTLPAVRRTLDRVRSGANDPLADDSIRELERAIDELEFDEDVDAGKTAEELRREIEDLRHENARLREEIGLSGEPYRKGASEKLGRNDPCWCGSGRKYKRCHLKSDQS
ncbi:SEC-C metal-binding domain-containing protein [Persicimonas caeni]|nr:SEC-C metal-binding domain-containing protein [Persicimonas caeni]